VATVQSVFHTLIDSLLAPSGSTYRANVSPLTLPPALNGLVTGVLGLDTSSLPHPNLVRAPQDAPTFLRGYPEPAAQSGGATPCAAAVLGGGYTSAQLAQAYDFNGLYQQGFHGEGMSAALVEFDDYHDSNLAAMESCYGVRTAVTRRLVDGGTGGPPGPAEAEDMADITTLLEMAPRLSHLYVYEAPITANAEIDLYNAFVTDDRAPVLSASWGDCEDTNSQAETRLFSDIVEEAAAQGQQIFDAAGDTGSVGCPDVPTPTAGSINVEQEAAVPWITGVGGTDLGALSTVPAPLGHHDEATWNDGGAGGGGVSSLWTMPSWQAALPSARSAPGATGAACGAPTGQLCREVPDIALNADPGAGGALDMTRTPPQLFPDVGSPGYSVYCATPNCSLLGPILPIVPPTLPGGLLGWQPIGGTSLATPLAAAAAVLWDQEAKAKGLGTLGFLNPALYRVAANPTDYKRDFFDITSDSNDAQYDTAACPSGCNPNHLYAAAPGYDMATGLGSIDAANLGADVIADAGHLDVTPQTVNLYGYLRGPSTTSPLSVTGDRSGTFTATSAARWLHVRAGSFPGQLAWSASPRGLAAGSYTGTIAVHGPGGASASVNVSYQVTPRATISVPQTPLQFKERAIDSTGNTIAPTCGSTLWNDELKDLPALNGPGDTSAVDSSTKQQLTITNGGPAGSVLHWSAFFYSETGLWLSPDLQPSGVSLQIAPTAPLISTEGSLAAGAQSHVALASVANANAIGGYPPMEQGTYHGQVVIRDLGDPSVKVTVPAVLVLGSGNGTPTIAAAPGTISLTLAPGASQVVPITLSDSSKQCGYVYSVQTGAPWATVPPDLFSGEVAPVGPPPTTSATDTGEGDGSVPVTISAAGLSGGVYHTSVTINSQTAEPNPTVVPVTLTVPGGPSTCPLPSTLRFGLYPPRGERVTSATVAVNGRIRTRARGRSLKAVSVRRPASKRFTVTITTTRSNGEELRSIRTYDGCRRTRVKTEVIRPARR
jgi:kumamolisin